MKVMVAVPTHDQMPALSAYDLAQMMAFLGANYVGEDRPISAISLTFCTGTYVHTAREQLARMAVEAGADYVLWVDADMRFPKDALIRLLKHRKDIVGINYSNRGVPPGFVAIKTIKPAERLVTGPDSTGLEPVEALGFGLTLMRGSVLRRIAEKHRRMFWYDENEDGGLVGEDVYFCKLARQEGFDIHVDHDLSKACAHVGVFEYLTDHPYAILTEK